MVSPDQNELIGVIALVLQGIHLHRGGNRTMVAAATIVSMAAADGERISIFPLHGVP